MASNKKKRKNAYKPTPQNISINLTINISVTPDGGVEVDVGDVKKIHSPKCTASVSKPENTHNAMGPVRALALDGEDDRREVHTLNDDDIIEKARAVCGIVKASDIEETEPGTGLFKINALTLNELIKSEKDKKGWPLCSDEPFREQPTGALCGTAFLIDHNKLATARHCVKDNGVGIENVKFVFGYELDDNGHYPDIIRVENIYEGSVVASPESKDKNTREDWAIVELTRSVSGVIPLVLRKHGKVEDDKPVYVIGHPKGLPKKFADGAKVIENINNVYFTATLDTYKGNSGSPVFNAETHEVEGILIRGNTDFEEDTSNDCYRSKVYDPNEVESEVVTRIKYVATAWEGLDNTA